MKLLMTVLCIALGLGVGVYYGSKEEDPNVRLEEAQPVVAEDVENPVENFDAADGEGENLSENGTFYHEMSEFSTHQRLQKEIEGRVVTMDMIRLEGDRFQADFSHDQANPFRFDDDGVVDDERARVVVNGGFFESNYQPSGYLRVGEEVLNATIVGWDLAGFVELQDGTLNFSLASEVNPENLTGEMVLQSFPLLVHQGQRLVGPDWRRTAFRTLIGVDQAGNHYVILCSDISFYDLAVWLMELDTSFQSVLNLDGGSSSALWIENEGYEFFVPNLVRVANVFYWYER